MVVNGVQGRTVGGVGVPSGAGIGAGMGPWPAMALSSLAVRAVSEALSCLFEVARAVMVALLLDAALARLVRVVLMAGYATNW